MFKQLMHQNQMILFVTGIVKHSDKNIETNTKI